MAGRGPPYNRRAGSGPPASHGINGNGRGPQGQGGGDLYQQLIENNDLVRELDDIEAISQQISQHAEVLYQNWKQHSNPSEHLASRGRGNSNGSIQRSLSNPGQGNGNPGNSYHQTRTISIDHDGQRSTSSLSQSSLNGGPVHSSGYTTTEPSGGRYGTSTLPTRLHQQIAQAQSSPSSSSYAPSSASHSTASSSGYSSRSATLPSRSGSGRSVTQIGTDYDSDSAVSRTAGSNGDQGGNLKELVNSFVSTDRAKQAARNTISSTISNMRMRSPSPSLSTNSSFSSSRGMSPLKSPLMLTGGGSGTPPGPLSPSASSTTSTATSLDGSMNGMGLGSRSSTPRTLEIHRSGPSSNSSLDNIHTRMTPIFNHGLNQQAVTSNGTRSNGSTVTRDGGKSWAQQKLDRLDSASNGPKSINIPVQHLTATASSPSGLQSPKVLQGIGGKPASMAMASVNSNNSGPSSLGSNTVMARRNSNRNSLEFDMPLPALHAANVDRMRKRFEEAKQRIDLMHQRAMDSGLLARSGPGFNSVKNAFERIADVGEEPSDFFSLTSDLDDGSNLLLEQLRRRSARRRSAGLEIPIAPHPELTPTQKQHIFERSVTPSSLTYNSQGFPLRRFLSGGSVAERVLIFERCPVFSAPELKESRLPAALTEKKKEPAVNSWRNTSDVQSKTQIPPSLTHQSSSSPTPASPPTSPQLSGGRGRDIPIVTPPRSSSLNISTSGHAQIKPVSPTPSSPPSSKLSPPLMPKFATPTQGQSVTPLSNSIHSAPSVVNNNSILREPKAQPHQPSLTSKQQQPTFTSSLLGSRSSVTPPKVVVPVPPRPRSTLVEELATKAKSLPKFHFPYGNPVLNTSAESSLKLIQDAFRKQPNVNVTTEQLGQILKKSGFPVSWKGVLFNASGGDKTGSLSSDQFAKFWRRMSSQNHDESSQFVFILTRGMRRYLLAEDFVPLIQDVVDTHPGLGFLKEATEFHSRYVHTVIARIFFSVNRSWSGRITIPEMRKSNFLAVLRLLEVEEDINQITDFFSYEHFYVIYCKFWELDKDHDLFIDREDLSRHNDHAISTRMIDRIFSGAVTRGSNQREGKMSYTEFVWFLLAEEDKRHPTSIEYWFRTMDLDGDGYLSMYELEYFYEEQLQRMEQLGIETLPFEDCLCQMLDMIMPKDRTKIALTDLKNCRMTPIFFDTFFNLEKYLDHEQRDPFASQRDVDEDGNEMSDWDRFAAEEYELLVAEEGNAEGMDDLCYEDDADTPEANFEEALDNAVDDGEMDESDGITNDHATSSKRNLFSSEPMITSS